MQTVTVAIPTIGREETLPAVLNAIAFQSHPVDELIILDEAKKPIAENFAINQAMDLLSLQGTRVVLLRERRKNGIGNARYRLCGEARNNIVLQVDDDVVLRPDCLARLLYSGSRVPWVVPTCVLVPGFFALDGYLDTVVDPDDPRVTKWTSKYPWFIPYYRYSVPVVRDIECAGTQCILLDRSSVLSLCEALQGMGRLPREDTYLTAKLGPGRFVSEAECLHYEHPNQTDRSNWGTAMFYRLHEMAMEDPDHFVASVSKGER